MRYLFNTRNIHFFFIFLLTFLSVLFFFGGPDYYSPRSFKSIWNLGHILFYTVLISYLLRFWPRYASLGIYKQVGWGLVLTIFSGIAVESLQIQFSRLPEFGDIWRDILGCLLAFLFHPDAAKKFHSKAIILFKLFVLFFILIELSYPLKFLLDEIVAKQQFPLLSSFETPFETDRWEAEDRLWKSQLYSADGNYSAKIILNTDLYSGIALVYFPRDWSNYHSLHFSVFNPDQQPLPVTCRIHDWEHIITGQQFSDRLNKRLVLNPGWNKIVISMQEIQNAPAGRLMNLKRIYNFGFFAISLKEERVIYLDDVKLE